MKGVAFVVLDTHIQYSFASLSKAGFLPCTERLDCPHSNTLRCPSPATHLHINNELTVSLYRKSDVLQEFPDFELTSKDSCADIIRASDTRLPPASLGRGQGRFSADLSSVRIPSPLRYCEAIIFLLCRDYGSVRETYWMSILTYILEFVDEMGLMDEEGLGEGYKQFYQAMKHGDSNMYLVLDGLRRNLIERRLLPASQLFNRLES